MSMKLTTIQFVPDLCPFAIQIVKVVIRRCVLSRVFQE